MHESDSLRYTKLGGEERREKRSGGIGRNRRGGQEGPMRAVCMEQSVLALRLWVSAVPAASMRQGAKCGHRLLHTTHFKQQGSPAQS